MADERTANDEVHRVSWADRFSHFSRGTASMMGHPTVFLGAVAVVLLWAVSGPLFGFSATWQLVINTGTTIVTFLMVFLIQNTQNRDSKALHLKLDAIIDGLDDVREDMVDIEDAPEAEIEAVQQEYARIRQGGPIQTAAEVATRASHVAATAGAAVERTESTKQ